MVRHYDKITYQVPFSVKVKQAIGNDPRQLRLPQNTRPVAIVETLVPSIGKNTSEFPTKFVP
jgi:hypothetical protein